MLGQAVLGIIAAPQRIFPVPVDYKSLVGTYLQLAGFKTLRAMYNATDLECSIEMIEGRLRITPMSVKERGHFLCGEDDKPTDCEPIAEIVGRALFDVLGLV
jgi:hypothetical protein